MASTSSTALASAADVTSSGVPVIAATVPDGAKAAAAAFRLRSGAPCHCAAR
jgi:hypothetical protein